ncbi:ORC-CDC6 family AAA ATPase [Pectobacterium brasiliense]|uniref:ORC-CDC6 family AAA ATPase n=1 Tax=Pectobacterium brasiliense TaxID=180957 RepID=UPI0025A2A3CF|nr:hypothetical protein [Pectobacterium brasiliense]WJM81637.1 hypothetical protein QTI90_02440 [Pectobacterium brasiliense]
MPNFLSDVFAKNRTEEFPDDVYDKYVLPLDYNEIDISKATKACVIVGGRGSGKTMYIKYYCYPTILSEKKKEVITLDDIKNLGIYWRPDTTFTQHLSQDWLGKYWSSAFNSYMTLSILLEYSGLINSLLKKNSPLYSKKDSLSKFEIPKDIVKSLQSASKPILLKDGKDIFREAMFSLCNWINSPFEEVPPIRLDIKSTLGLLTSQLRDFCPEFNDIIFHIFIDEFENLTQEQQVIINTLMKHGRNPLIFSVAHKKNAEVSHNTLSSEKVVERNDFKTIDLDVHYNKKFETFAGEVLALRLSEYIDNSNEDIKAFLQNKDELKKRSSKNYYSAIKSLGHTFLPSKSHKEISKEIFDDFSFKRKIKNLISDGLVNVHHNKSIKPDSFIDINFPEASLVCSVLLNRKRNSPEYILDQFENYKTGQDSKFQSWIHNNLVGVILLVYKSFSEKICPLYAGYEQYVLLSKGNIRHFLELCHQSTLKGEYNDIFQNSEICSLPIEIQASATKRTSDLELEKISDLGAHGSHLKKIANRLGRIFSYSQSRKTQSEVEINHFTLDLSEKMTLDDDTRTLLSEALIWSVLVEEDSTKSKVSDSIETKDYLLHPVLSAHFGISYRKKKKLKLTREQLTIIFTENDDKFNALLKKFGTAWDLDDDIESLDQKKGEFGKQMGLL